ncbi:MAG: amidohydrolase, partial [Acidobacteria bacterium]|nr:amidohydrolase [Acidobacteriota bacterium]
MFHRIAVLAVLIALAAPAAAQEPGAWDDRIQEAVSGLEAETVAFREHVHEFPELGNREFETARMVAEHLRELGFDEVREG